MNRKEYLKQWRESNKEKLKEYRRTTYSNCKEESNKRSKAYYSLNRDKYQEINQQYQINNPEKRLYVSCKSTAKIKGYDFDLELSDIVIPTLCPILRIELTNRRGCGRASFNPSIDRIDPSKGYIKSNIQVISDLANRMKQDATKEQLIAFAKGVLEMYA